MNKTVLGLIGCGGLLFGFFVILALAGTGHYNGLVGEQEKVSSTWADVETAYQRRADLIPNLVATVKGSADFEQETLTQVVEARSRVGQVSAEAVTGLVENPAAMEQFQQAQGSLSSALSRLLVVVERYPDLKSTQAFRDLMVQLEGTENRINVARGRYNEAVNNFNSHLAKFPANLLVSLFGWDFTSKVYYQAEAGAEVAPEVNFQ